MGNILQLVGCFGMGGGWELRVEMGYFNRMSDIAKLIANRKEKMKSGILILIAIGFSNLAFSQIKSERRVAYWVHKKVENGAFHKNTPKDSCVIFWEEYNRNGKITKEYDFPADKCWQINGPWEHHYFYDNNNRLIEHRDFGGEEGKERTLMRDFFYSYPYLNEPNKANEFYFVYKYKATTSIEEEQIDTFYLDTVNTKGMFDFSRTGWKFDTIKFNKGSYIFRKDFTRNKELFNLDLILTILDKESIEDFEIDLLNNLNQISDKLTEIYETDESYLCEFEFREKENPTSVKFKLSK